MASTEDRACIVHLLHHSGCHWQCWHVVACGTDRRLNKNCFLKEFVLAAAVLPMPPHRFTSAEFKEEWFLRSVHYHLICGDTWNIGLTRLSWAQADLRQYINELMVSTGGCAATGYPIASCKIYTEKSYAFLEFRSVEEASNCMAFDGVAFKDSYLRVSPQL